VDGERVHRLDVAVVEPAVGRYVAGQNPARQLLVRVLGWWLRTVDGLASPSDRENALRWKRYTPLLHTREPTAWTPASQGDTSLVAAGVA
jgi:hypothetical protein